VVKGLKVVMKGADLSAFAVRNGFKQMPSAYDRMSK